MAFARRLVAAGALASLFAGALAAPATAAPKDPPAPCPGYSYFSQQRHEPFSSGKYKLSWMRPEPRCRTVVSPDVEAEIERMRGRIKDPDLFRLFENAFPNTLDATVQWQGKAANNSDEELAFLITGDIPAMWLRDSANQLQPYRALLKKNASTPVLGPLFRGAINLQARYLRSQPFCEAFQAPPEAGGAPQRGNGADVDITPPFDPMLVWECDWEIDSPAAFLQLSHDYWNATGDTAFFKRFHWVEAVEAILDTAEAMMTPTYGPDGALLASPYVNTGRNGQGTFINRGKGPPTAAGTGLVRTFFRPSDDQTTYQLFIPGNMMLASYLKLTAKIMLHVGRPDLGERMFMMGTGITRAVHKHGIVNDTSGPVYAYEVDGFGGRNMMDDANVPSLLAAPLSGFVDRQDPVYRATRARAWSTANPYYAHGPALAGIGGPHTSAGMVWPMSLIVRILTSDDETEVYDTLKDVLRSTSGYGLIHESVDSHRGESWTRHWFSWGNSLFGLMILDLDERMPQVLRRSFQ